MDSWKAGRLDGGCWSYDSLMNLTKGPWDFFSGAFFLLSRIDRLCKKIQPHDITHKEHLEEHKMVLYGNYEHVQRQSFLFFKEENRIRYGLLYLSMGNDILATQKI